MLLTVTVAAPDLLDGGADEADGDTTEGDDDTSGGDGDLFSVGIAPKNASVFSLGVYVSGEEELQDALDDEGVMDITLTDDIVIRGGVSAWAEGREVTIHLGEYCIIVAEPQNEEDWGSLSLWGSVTLQGTDTGIVQNPGARLDLTGGVRIKMAGDGATALVLTDYASTFFESVEIEVCGGGAVGILGNDMENILTLSMMRVTASGEETVAVYSSGGEPLVLEQCTLQSEGGPTVEAEGDTYAYHCVINPLPDGVHAEEGTLRPRLPYKLAIYQNFEKGPEELWLLPDWFFDYSYNTASPLPDREGENHFMTAYCDITWDLSELDASTPGVYTIAGRIDSPIEPPGMPLPDVFCEITVVALNKPYLG